MDEDTPTIPNPGFAPPPEVFALTAGELRFTFNVLRAHLTNMEAALEGVKGENLALRAHIEELSQTEDETPTEDGPALVEDK